MKIVLLQIQRAHLSISFADSYKQADDKNFYHFHSSEKNWEAARSTCKQEQRGARLAIIDKSISLQAINDNKILPLSNNDM